MCNKLYYSHYTPYYHKSQYIFLLIYNYFQNLVDFYDNCAYNNYKIDKIKQ